jgi:GAF domain-containing protein/multidrug resistance efflux pump
LDQLLPIICEKIGDIMEADTCTIWLLDDSGEQMRFGFSAGGYSEVFSKYSSKLEDDPAGEIIQKGEGILLADATAEDRLQKRFAGQEESSIATYLAAPLECKGQILGTLEVADRLNDRPYNEEDQFLLNDLSHQAAVAIHNANLLQTERRAKELDALLNISREITSTLNLDRVLLTIVNQAATLVPYDRAAIALIDRGRVELAAVSGKMEVDKNHPEMKDFQGVLTWCANLEKGLYISEFEGSIVTDREENRQKFRTHFEKTGFKSFVSMPLTDEEGKLGILSFESASPYFLDERHLEVLTILANQATVAIRNAQLYRQVPLISLMQPIIEKKAKWRKMSERRKAAWLTIPGLTLLLLIFIPWRMDIVGDTTILPSSRTPVVSQVEGIVQKVNFREGDPVKKNAVIASLLDNDYKLALENSQTQRDLITKKIRQSESSGNSGAAKMQRIQLEQIGHDIQFHEYLLQNTRLVAPVDGVILTPRIEEKIGALLKKGEEFCEMADMRSARALIDVEEGDTAYVKPGERVRLKLNAYPTRKFYGTVKRLGAELLEKDSSRYFRIEAQIQSGEPLLKSGMVGKAKVDAGYRSIGYVLLRKPVRFIWKKLWVWAP